MVSRGQLVLATQPTLTNQATSGDVYSAEFSVTLTWEMTPVTDVVAYQLVTSGGLLKELATDSMRINVHGLVQNKVNCEQVFPHLSLLRIKLLSFSFSASKLAII